MKKPDVMVEEGTKGFLTIPCARAELQEPLEDTVAQIPGALSSYCGLFSHK